MYQRIKNTKSKYEIANPLAPGYVGAVYSELEWATDAVVVDVITNEDHPKHSKDGFNVGCIQFRSLSSGFFRAQDNLNWAFPVDSLVEEFPLKNEIVHVFKSLNRIYYSRTINLGNRPSHQAFFGLASEMGTPPNSVNKVDTLEQSKYSPKNETKIDENPLGNYFKDMEEVSRLKHWEGDKIIQGRSGQTIRFGTAWLDPSIYSNGFQSLENDQSPNIIIRVGPYNQAAKTTDNRYGRVVEDINNDKTSIWMTTDQAVDLKTATDDSEIHAKSILEYPTNFDKNQLILNSGRLIFNSKTDKILMHSLEGIHSNTLKDFTVDAGRDYVSYLGRDNAIEIINNDIKNVGKSKFVWVGSVLKYDVGLTFDVYSGRFLNLHSQDVMSLVSKKIFLGSLKDDSEPLVLGNTLVDILTEFIQAILSSAPTHVVTPVGPGALAGGAVTAYQTLLSKLETALSEDNFVNKKNETPTKPAKYVAIHPKR